MRRRYEDIPFTAANWPFFYGWFILACGTLGILMSIPGQTVGFSAFTEPLIEALRLRRTALSTAYLIGTGAGGLMLPWAGRVYDRFGARRVGAVSAFVFGAVLMGLSRMDVLAAWITRTLGEPPELFGVAGATVVSFAVATVGIFLARFVGQGVMTMVSRNMIMKWFDHRRGFANGIMSIFIPLAFSLAPYLFNHAIELIGWRATWMISGAVVGLGFSTFVLLFYRDNPEDCRLLPDGAAYGRQNGDGPIHHPPVDFTAGQARRTYTFWVFNLAIAMQALYLTAVTFHVEDVFGEGGIGRTAAFASFLPSSVIAVVTGFLAGWISDHIKLKFLLITMIAGMIISMSGLVALRPGWPYWLVVVGRGLSGGLFGILMAMTWPRMFGRRHLGAVSGYHIGWVVMFSAIGPLFYALSNLFTRSYTAAVGACIAVMAVLLVLSVRADRPPPPQETAD